ncbi:MAG TPA: alpha-amylase family glycosyl hydrolase, partial [Actinomycetota bacterium]|nr:alpha-amylase family glycosyl hydrolase [Actinomycetota bacterium]
GGQRLNRELIGRHHEYSIGVHAYDAAALAARVMELDAMYDPNVVAVQLNLLGSHDTPRLRSVLGDDLAAVRLATLLQMTLPGAPCVYYGDEIGLRGGNDPECRGAFPWNDAHWDGSLRDTVRALIQLRRSEAALRDGPVRIAAADGHAIAIERGAGEARFVVAANAGEAPATVRVTLADDPGAGPANALVPVDLPGLVAPTAAAIVGAVATVELPERSGTIFRVS